MERSGSIIRKILIVFIIYSIVLLFIGRHMTFLPTVPIGKNESSKIVKDTVNEEVLGKFLAEEEGTYSIYFKDLNTGEEFGLDENKVLTAASLNKLIIVSYLYSQAEKGDIDLEEKITISESDVQDYGTGSIRYETMPKAYSLKQLVKLALEQSDNTAAYVLTIRLGEATLQNYARDLGLSATDIVGNKTSAKDMGQILEKIYKGEITSEPLTLEILDFMKDTLFEDRLARNFQEDVNIYHKAADAITMVHDVGIIDDGKNPFILAILTTDIVSEDKAKEGVGKIAKFIYDERK